MLKNLIFGKEKSDDHAIGVYVGLFFGVMSGLFGFFDNWWNIFSVLLVLLFSYYFVWFLVKGVWFDDAKGASRGLIFGSLLGAAFAEFFSNVHSFWHLLGVFILMEFIFKYFDEPVPKKKDHILKFTGKRKLVCLLQAIIIYVGVYGGSMLSWRLYPQTKEFLPEIMKWIGYTLEGIVMVTLAIFIGSLSLVLNSMKYKR